MLSTLNLLLRQNGDTYAACISTHNPRTTGPMRERIPWYTGSDRIVEITQGVRNIYLRMDERRDAVDVYGEYATLVPPQCSDAQEFLKEQLKKFFKNTSKIRNTSTPYPGYLHTAQEAIKIATTDSVLEHLTSELLPQPGMGKVLVLTSEFPEWKEFGQHMWRTSLFR